MILEYRFSHVLTCLQFYVRNGLDVEATVHFHGIV